MTSPAPGRFDIIVTGGAISVSPPVPNDPNCSARRVPGGVGAPGAAPYVQLMSNTSQGIRSSGNTTSTGEAIEPAGTQPKIKGLARVGGLGTGDVLAGFDKAAFQSYGLKQAANAAMSEATVTAYTETLSRLIADRNVKLGNTLTVWWFTGQADVTADDDVMAWFSEPPEQTSGAAERHARTLLTAIATGQRNDLAGSRFVALLLSGAAGRVMVREVEQGSFEELVAHTESWFRDLSMVARDGKGLARDPKFLAVAGGLVRDLKDWLFP